LVCSRADKVWPELADCAGEKIALDLKVFLTQPQPVKVELVRRSLTTIGCGERDLTQLHYDRILLLSGQNITGGKMDLPGGFVVRLEYGNLIFARRQKKAHLDKQVGEIVELEVPGRTSLGRYLIEAEIFEDEKPELEKFMEEKTNCVERFDLEKLKLPLVVRFRRVGDRFVPLGLAEEKKLGKFLTAQRVPHHIRRKALIVADCEKIIWLWPIRMGEQAKVNGESRNILQLQITDARPAR
jgi:tRNA(Ile)-lysidine synthase